jgi:hypothetical protein
MAVDIIGARILEKPVGLPQLRRVILVASPAASLHS